MSLPRKSIKFTFFTGVERVFPRHVLNVIDELRLGQNNLVSVDFMHGVFEGNLNQAVLLVIAKYGTCKE